MIVVPTEAIVRDERGTSVFVAANDTSGTVAQRREVELGPDAGATVVLRSGVEPGDRIIVSGASELAEGGARPASPKRGLRWRSPAARPRPRNAPDASPARSTSAAVEPRREP